MIGNILFVTSTHMTSQRAWVFVLIAFVVGVAAGLIPMVLERMNEGPTSTVSQTKANNAVETAIPIQPDAEAPEAPKTSVPSEDTPTYTNAFYGWSIDYPTKDWTAIESADGVSLSSIKTATDFPVGSERGKASSATISFSTVNKSTFVPVGTKVGNIRYDLTLDALIDTSGDTNLCLPPLPQNAANPNPDLAIFAYGGSLMSDPAYHWYGVMTNKDYIIIVKTTSYSSADEPSIRDVFSTLSLPSDVTSTVPACAKGE